MKIVSSATEASLDSLVLFAFDDYAIPFQRGVELTLATGQGRGRVVLAPGINGSPDSKHVAYYGTVLKVGQEYWMWYLGQGDVESSAEDPWHQRICLATSQDGYTWSKPSLGLVDYGGNKANNLIDMGSGIGHISACLVFHDPDELDPDRRFKMAFADRRYRNQLAVAFSADGLSWQESSKNPVGPWLEMSGGTKVDETYFLTGQGGMHQKDQARQFATHVSYDFENWSLATSLGLQRQSANPNPRPFSKNESDQIHLGAGLWNRGNVIVGFYGMWNGHPSNDRRMVTMDLGLAVSHDALHYREPIPNFPIVTAAEDSWKRLPEGPWLPKFPALMQGQGFENIDEETLFWYSPWPEQKSDGVRVAVWPRDRLGYLQAYSREPISKGEILDTHIVTAPIDLEGHEVQVSLNFERSNEHCDVSVSILDERFLPIEGYARENCLRINSDGFRQFVQWQDRKTVSNVTERIRVRIDFDGIRFEDTRLYAIYLDTVI